MALHGEAPHRRWQIESSIMRNYILLFDYPRGNMEIIAIALALTVDDSVRVRIIRGNNTTSTSKPCTGIIYIYLFIYTHGNVERMWHEARTQGAHKNSFGDIFI